MDLILCIDIGTSSIRCSAFEILQPSSGRHDPSSNLVAFVSGSLSSKRISCIEPRTGNINIYPYHTSNGSQDADNHSSIFDVIDSCVDETLTFLRCHSSYSSSSILGMGFSSFVMNLIGVDRSGKPLGPQATMSYACNSRHVQEECQRIHR
jgi:sugar (pentulose or hexulose) kinase